MGIRNFADALSCSVLVDAANRYLHRHFVGVSKSEEFLALSINEVLDLIHKDEIDVQCEEQVY